MSSHHSTDHRRVATAAGVLAVALAILLISPTPLSRPLGAVVDLQSFWAACVALLPFVLSGFLTGSVAAILSIAISHRRHREDPRGRAGRVAVATLMEAAQ